MDIPLDSHIINDMNVKNKNTKKVSLKNKLPLIGAISLILILVLLLVIMYIVPQSINMVRKNKITSVYTSLDLGGRYLVQSQDIFGDKRKYDWDSSRSYSSSIDYVRSANVDVATRELQSKVEAAGFKLIDHPYPYQWQYKSDGNIHLRFNALSKPQWDCFFNSSQMGKEVEPNECGDPNQGPTHVTVKVNLDDNNE
jgi:hypothetical protein